MANSRTNWQDELCHIFMGFSTSESQSSSEVRREPTGPMTDDEPELTEWKPALPEHRLLDRSRFIALDCEMIDTITVDDYRRDLKEKEARRMEKELKKRLGVDPGRKAGAQAASSTASRTTAVQTGAVVTSTHSETSEQDVSNNSGTGNAQKKEAKVKPWRPRHINTLARVSIVGWDREVILDLFVQPPKGTVVFDYRTWVSGIRRDDIKASNGAVEFRAAQKQVLQIIQDRWVIGHSLVNDFRALGIEEKLPRLARGVIDTAMLSVYKTEDNKSQSLGKLCQQFLGREMQGKKGSRRHGPVGGQKAIGHSPIEDATVTMELFQLKQDEMMEAYEAALRGKKSVV